MDTLHICIPTSSPFYKRLSGVSYIPIYMDHSCIIKLYIYDTKTLPEITTTTTTATISCFIQVYFSLFYRNNGEFMLLDVHNEIVIIL